MLVVNSSSSGSIVRGTTTKTFEDIIEDRDANPPASDQASFEAMLWEQIPWVVCAKDGRTNCSGTISKADWLADRAGTCSAAVVNALEQNPGSLAVELDLCNLNSQMDSMCRKISQAGIDVASANCLAMAGTLCLDKSYFYTPSTYSVTNQQVCSITI